MKRKRFVATTANLINRGQEYAERRGCTAIAAACFARALNQAPRDATAAYNLGVVTQDMGELDEALEYYERAVEADPTLAEAHYNAADVCRRLNQDARANRHLHAYRALTGERW